MNLDKQLRGNNENKNLYLMSLLIIDFLLYVCFVRGPPYAARNI